MPGRDDSVVFHLDSIDEAVAAAFDPAKPWIFEFGVLGQECFVTEDDACAAQRRYREKNGFDPLTGELAR